MSLFLYLHLLLQKVQSKQTRTNSQPTNTVPAQNAHQSKILQQDPKDKLSRKRSQTSSSQTPPKRAKLASNAPGPSNTSIPQHSSRMECTPSDRTPVVRSTSVTNIHGQSNEESEKAQNQSHGLSTAPEEDVDMLLGSGEDVDMLLGSGEDVDMLLGSGSPIDDSLLDSQHQNDHHRLLGVETDDALLGEDFLQTDSPPDGTLLDSLTHEDNPGPSYVSSDSESSPIVILDDDSDSDTN